MIHYGDVQKIKGAEVPLVDVITFGAPCQDLSIAGGRAGMKSRLNGDEETTRSGLFFEAIRIIKEMRDDSEKRYGQLSGTDDSIRLHRPRYAVYENVPGAFSSNNGEDFRAVLEETAKVKDKNASIPRPSGKWGGAGCILGDGWSIAWRTHDAQYWGVPQRRKRICMVADFDGDTAGKILFDIQLRGETEYAEYFKTFASAGDKPESKIQSVSASVSGNNEPCNEEGERTPGGIENGVGATSYTLKIRGGTEVETGCNTANEPIAFEPGAATRVGGHVYGDGVSGTIRSNAGDNKQAICYMKSENTDAVCIENHPADSRVKVSDDGICQSLTSRMGTGGGNVPLVMEPVCVGVSKTLNCMDDPMKVMTPDVHTYQNTGQGWWNESGVGATIRTNCGGDAVKANLTSNGSVVRRLTPTECERLQGYPDGWTNIGEWIDSKGKNHKDADSPRYKALGNSIALPFWQWMAERMVKCLRDDGVTEPTMASLFDGIGGFPVVYSRNGCRPVWASEIEEFAIAVTKKRFPEE